MAQYSIITEGTPLTISDGVDTFRYFVDSAGDMLLQQLVDSVYEDIEQYTNEGGGVYRVGVRDTYWNLDCTITETGFSGDEDTDWTTINQYKLP